MKPFLFIALCTALLSPAMANLKDATKVSSSGKWTVLREINKMTDKVLCTGIHDGNYGRQLSSDGLYIMVGGGIKSVTMRFDDAPAQNLRLGTKMESDIRAVILDGADFQSVTSSKRLRMQVGTLVSGLQEFDLDMTGIGEAYENIKAGCPVVSDSPVALPVPTTTPASIDTSNSCTVQLVAKMQKAGVSKKQVAQVCSAG